MSQAVIGTIMREVETSKKQLPQIEFRNLNRREFLKLSGFAVTGMTLAYGCISSEGNAGATKEFMPNGFVQISADGVITLYSKAPEIGQGIKTSFPMILAEELDANWDEVRIKQAPIDHATYGPQFAGGSMNTPLGWEQHRQAGAMARAMLVQAAGIRWGVSSSELTTENSRVYWGQKSLSYSELAPEAAELPLPDASNLKLKDRKDWKLLGRRIPGVENEAIVTGRPLFGIDAVVPGMHYATYDKCPAFGGTVIRANLDEIKRLPGVTDAFILSGNHTEKLGDGVMPYLPGVAIVAKSTWAAMQARKQLQIEWDESGAAKDSSESAALEAERLKDTTGKEVLFETGDVKAGLANGAHTLKAFYRYAFVAHAPMEPQNCTAWYHDDQLDVWAPTQTPQRAIRDAAAAIGLAEDRVTVNQLRMGGGFGRRLLNDYVAEAAAITKQAGVPVKLQWTREDDMRHDYYRVAGYHALQGAVDDQGRLDTWTDHFITFSGNGENPVSGGDLRANDIAQNLIKNVHISQTMLPLQVPCGPWRAPGATAITFAVQSFIHELASAAGRDHVEFLLEIMGEPRWLNQQGIRDLNTGRAADVIKLAAQKSGWGKAMPKGRALGMAFSFAHAGHIAEVADVSVDENRKVTIHRMTVVADVGPVINRSAAENQCQGCVIDGISTMMGLEVSFENGRIQQSNFDRYPLLRVGQAPRVDVHFIESDYAPTGLGEPGIPPVAPAVTNAIFAASGYRIRQLPLSSEGFSI